MDKIIYFELNNWIPGIFYPDDEPFRLWMKNDLQIKFDDETWVKKSRLCVVRELIDMSSNYCITATREWVVNNCPKLLTDYAEFIRYKEFYCLTMDWLSFYPAFLLLFGKEFDLMIKLLDGGNRKDRDKYLRNFTALYNEIHGTDKKVGE